jgi:hypothetical protein
MMIYVKFDTAVPIPKDYSFLETGNLLKLKNFDDMS